ncbi:MAG: transposase [Oligoflexia bacterium]|nr:transposase [Oligoflexia bacterium]
MPIIKIQFESGVSNANKDLFTRSYIEDSVTIMEFDTRLRKYKGDDGSKLKIKWGECYKVDINELSTMYNAIKYRFILAKGAYSDSNGNRIFFTPNIEEVSTAQHISKSVVRLACYLAVICGVSLRNIATILTHLFLIDTTKSSVERWINEVGSSLPSEEEILKKLMAIQMPSECNIDGYYPMGTDNCVMVIKDELDRILITQEVNSENKEDAKKFLQKIKELGINIIYAFSDYSKSYIEPIKEVFPEAKFQADHFHTVKNIWKNLKDTY